MTGRISPCYKPTRWIVFVTSIPRGRFESQPTVVGADGRFTLTLDAMKLLPGDYFLNFGKTKAEAGGRRFAIKGDTVSVDFGQLGECDI